MQPKPRKTGTSSDGREMHYSAGVMVECKGRYLLQDRKSPPPGFAGPAGHLDEDEDDPKKAALRELKEETGIVLQDAEPLFSEEVPWNYCMSATVHYWSLYKASVDSFEVTIDDEESKSIGWYTPNEMRSMNLEPVWRYWFEKAEIL